MTWTTPVGQLRRLRDAGIPVDDLLELTATHPVTRWPNGRTVTHRSTDCAADVEQPVTDTLTVTLGELLHDGDVVNCPLCVADDSELTDPDTPTAARYVDLTSLDRAMQRLGWYAGKAASAGPATVWARHHRLLVQVARWRAVLAGAGPDYRAGAEKFEPLVETYTRQAAEALRQLRGSVPVAATLRRVVAARLLSQRLEPGVRAFAVEVAAGSPAPAPRAAALASAAEDGPEPNPARDPAALERAVDAALEQATARLDAEVAAAERAPVHWLHLAGARALSEHELTGQIGAELLHRWAVPLAGETVPTLARVPEPVAAWASSCLAGAVDGGPVQDDDTTDVLSLAVVLHRQHTNTDVPLAEFANCLAVARGTHLPAAGAPDQALRRRVEETP